MEGSVYQRKDHRWVGVVDVEKNLNGKRKQKYVYGKTKKEATIKLNNLIYQLQNNIYRDSGNLKFGTYLDNWFEQNNACWQETTAALYKMYIEKHIKPLLGNFLLKEIIPAHITEFKNQKLKENSSNTVLKYLALLHGAFDYARKNNLIILNPVDNVNRPKKIKYKPVIYNESQFFNLLERVEGTFDEIPILLAGACGFRRGEIFGLRWRDINFKDKTVSICQTNVRFDKPLIKKPKNETSNRNINVPDFVIDVLDKYKSSLKVIPEKVCKYEPQSYSDRFKLLLEKFEMPHIRLHDLRHFNAVIMMKYGVPDKVAAQRLGHSNTQTLREVYQHVLKDMDINAAGKINNMLIGMNS